MNWNGKDEQAKDRKKNIEQEHMEGEHVDYENNKKKTSGGLQSIGYITQMGVNMAVTIMVGVFVGRFLDGIFDTSPWLLLICSLLGVGAAIKNVFDMSKNKK